MDGNESPSGEQFTMQTRTLPTGLITEIRLARLGSIGHHLWGYARQPSMPFIATIPGLGNWVWNITKSIQSILTPNC